MLFSIITNKLNLNFIVKRTCIYICFLIIKNLHSYYMISYFFKKIKTINFQKYQRSHYIENESNKISSRKDLNASDNSNKLLWQMFMHVCIFMNII